MKGLLAVAAAVLCASLAWTARADVDWPAVWDELALLEASEREAPGTVERAERLATLARGAHQGGEAARALLLLARVERWYGRPTQAVVERLAAAPLEALGAREAWLAVALLPPGAPRVATLLRALEATPELSDDQARLAWRAGVDEARALRLEEGAGPIQLALHERYRAEWTALNLAVTLSRLGRRTALDRLMQDAIAREEAEGRSAAALWSQWGVSTLGFGDEARARDYLGKAVARGSSDAALVLALLELEAGNAAAARNAFRASILSDPPSAWGLRGWGLSLLPEPATLPAALPQEAR